MIKQKVKKFLLKLLVANLPVILLFIILFGFIAALLDEDGSSNGGSTGNAVVQNVSADVLKWRPTIEKYANQFQVSQYVPLMLALIQQESSGQLVDVMQSSEGAFNTRYPKWPNGITDSDYSIWCGVQEFKAAITRAGVKGPDDIQGISLALQTYNYGTGFFDYAKSRGGYSLSVAKEFSIMMAKKMGWSSYGDPEYVQHVLRYYALSATSAPAGNNELLNKVVKKAYENLNHDYVWGASGPNNFDCSGLVYFCYKEAGFKIDRTTAQGYYDMCDKITNPEIGDLVFFRFANDPDGCHHIGIYVGNNMMIHAPKTGDVVKVSQYLNRSDFIGYGRLRTK